MDRPSTENTASVAATLNFIGVEDELIPLVLNILRLFVLDKLKAFVVPKSDFRTSERPPLPVVSIKLAWAPVILFTSFTKPWIVLLELSMLIVVV